jgi:hypothetical protein
LHQLLPADHSVLKKARHTIFDGYRVNGLPDQAEAWRDP